MKVVILAAGKGVRLRPITETRPKPLIPVLCKPLLLWHLDYLLTNSSLFDEIIIVVNYLKEKIIDAVRKHPLHELIRFIEQGEELGTGDAVYKAIKDLDDNEEVLVIYSDLFIADKELYGKILRTEGNVVVGVVHENPSEYGVLIEENGLLKSIIEKPAMPPSNLVNAGIYKFRVGDLRPYLENLKPSVRGELEFTDALTNAVLNNTIIRILKLDGSKWIDIGLPWNILDANKMAFKYLVEGSKFNGVIESNVSIKGNNIVIEDGALIRSGTYIEGPVYIGSGAIIGPNARIRPYSVICNDSVVGFSVEVKESLIMEHVHVSHLSYVGDSIICEGVNFGAGTITANLRFDDKPVKVNIKDKRVSTGRRKFGAIIGGYVKTGINVSLMPGVKVGSYSWIAPGAVVYEDVPPRSFLRFKIEYYIEPLSQI